MRIGLIPTSFGSRIEIPIDNIKHAETLGFDSAWTAEAYGHDAVSTAAWILANTSKIKVGTAIMQMPARTPALAAMTAMTLAQLSGGRFIVGLGPSGPQVVEGWHGVPYGKPVTRLREYVTIMKQIFERKAPVEFDGKEYQLPYNGDDSSGLGKPLKSILHCAETIPIYAATITPNGVQAAAEVADGFFPVWMDPEQFHVFDEPIKKGFARNPGKQLKDFEILPFLSVVIGDDIQECMQPMKNMMALYIGGMGARSKNFYNDYAIRLGYEDAARIIQDLYLDGRKAEAAAAVPDELVDACHLVGPVERIRERAHRWQEAGRKGHVSSMLLGGAKPEAMELVADIFL